MAERAKDGAQPSTEILLEVVPMEASGDLAPLDVLPETFRKRASEIANSIGGIADELRSKLARIVEKSDERSWGVDSVEIGFNLTIQAGAGVIITKASAGATFSAKLTLKAPADPK
jgi:hypothetical protein